MNIFPLYPMEPLSLQDDSGALGRVAATCPRKSRRAYELSAEERSLIQRDQRRVIDNLYCKLQGQE